MSEGHIETVIVGGSQSGLAAGYHLAQRGLPFVILDENNRVGDAWRNRYDSLRLFTPRRYNGLPGMSFPGSSASYPTKDETADYLEAYAAEFELPVRNGVHVERLSKVADRFKVVGAGYTLTADNVVVATGAYHAPKIPDFADELDGNIVQLHSSEYCNPSQTREGPVLVVGAGNSGAEIAIDLASDHQTWLSGRDVGQEPSWGRPGSAGDRLLKGLMWFMATRMMTVTNPLGRRFRDHFLDPPRGIPLGGGRRKDIRAANVERVPRTAGVEHGLPVLEDGRVLDVSNVIWCTGYTPDYHWIDLPLSTHHGVPIHTRGIVETIPGLYFIGLNFQYSLSSALIGGVGRDAEFIVNHIATTRSGRKTKPNRQTASS